MKLKYLQMKKLEGRRKTLENRQSFDVEEIVKEYSDMVYRMAKLYGGTKEDAEDIFQEVFLRLMRYIHRLESREHIRNWLIRVAINCGKTQLARGRVLLGRKLGEEFGNGTVL